MESMSENNRIDYIGQIVNYFSPWLQNYYLKYRTLVNYLFAGGTAAFTNLFVLFLLTHVFGIWYLLSSIIAFLLAFVVSFYLQKHMTFEDHSSDGLHKQMTLYLFVALINLAINTALMYFFVDIVGIWYMFAQVLAAGLVAVESFFVYRAFIFKTSV